MYGKEVIGKLKNVPYNLNIILESIEKDIESGLKIVRENKDEYGRYTEIKVFGDNELLIRKSTLSNIDENNNYLTQSIEYYKENGELDSSEIYDLNYDSSNTLTSLIMNNLLFYHGIIYATDGIDISTIFEELNTNDKTILGAINEVSTNTKELPYTTEFENLMTSNKTIIGSINEIKETSTSGGIPENVHKAYTEVITIGKGEEFFRPGLEGVFKAELNSITQVEILSDDRVLFYSTHRDPYKNTNTTDSKYAFYSNDIINSEDTVDGVFKNYDIHLSYDQNERLKLDSFRMENRTGHDLQLILYSYKPFKKVYRYKYKIPERLMGQRSLTYFNSNAGFNFAEVRFDKSSTGDMNRAWVEFSACYNRSYSNWTYLGYGSPSEICGLEGNSSDAYGFNKSLSMCFKDYSSISEFEVIGTSMAAIHGYLYLESYDEIELVKEMEN